MITSRGYEALNVVTKGLGESAAGTTRDMKPDPSGMLSIVERGAAVGVITAGALPIPAADDRVGNGVRAEAAVH